MPSGPRLLARVATRFPEPVDLFGRQERTELGLEGLTVLLLACAEDLVGAKTREMGVLGDVAPTLLQLAGVPIPPEMSGVPLIP